ncbi:orotidine-5'-phosphate decarboxylase [Alicyclobacillus sp. TC]|uniref:orotidine-5'-phosphate decarboxylase n=1 Tax=Alicyclobacillus sp. TC TaxID=2606450 RepID=UPI001933EEF5|nr:orotidine-5'-phosphate decarboxylase [Alicyclobacillus sp. TC]
MYQEAEILQDTKYERVRDKVYVALDFPNGSAAASFVESMGPGVTHYKVGLELLMAEGPQWLEQMGKLGKQIFLDVKLHDIPNTVAGAIRALAHLPVSIINIHASGGRRMMEAAREALPAQTKIKLIGVTALTSLATEDVEWLGVRQTVSDWTLHLAKTCYDCGLDGVVASAHELTKIYEHLPKDFLTVIPGIRLNRNQMEDQVRVMTPVAAYQAGASYLVIGRAIRSAPYPARALQEVWESLLTVSTFH